MTAETLRSIELHRSYIGYSHKQVNDLFEFLASELDAGRLVSDLIPHVRLNLKFLGYTTEDVDGLLNAMAGTRVDAPGGGDLGSRTTERQRSTKVVLGLAVGFFGAVLAGAWKMQSDAQTRIHSWSLAIAESAAIYSGFFGLIFGLPLLADPILKRRHARDTPERRQHRAHRHALLIRGAALLIAPLLLGPGIELAVPSWTDAKFNDISWVCRSPIISAWAPSRPFADTGVQQIRTPPHRTVTLPNDACSSHARVRLGLGFGLILIGLLLTVVGIQPRFVGLRLSHLRF